MGGGASTYDRDVTDSSAKTFKPEDVIGMPPGPDTETWRVRRCDAQPPGQMSALISPPAPGVCMRGDRMETNTELFSSQARIESRCSTRAGKKRLNLLCTACGKCRHAGCGVRRTAQRHGGAREASERSVRESELLVLRTGVRVPSHVRRRGQCESLPPFLTLHRASFGLLQSVAPYRW